MMKMMKKATTWMVRGVAQVKAAGTLLIERIPFAKPKQRLKALAAGQRGATFMDILGYGALVVIIILALIKVVVPLLSPIITGWMDKLSAGN